MPEAPGCYALANFAEDILYIGKSENIRRRISEHLDNSEKTSETKQGYAHWAFCRVMEDIPQLGMLERGWTNQHELREGRLPILNSTHPPV